MAYEKKKDLNYKEDLGRTEFVNARPDLGEHVAANICGHSEPGLTAPDDEAPKESAFKPPVPTKEHMNAHPWGPPGRE